MTEFLEQIAQCLDRSSVTETEVLTDYPEWDSLSVLSVLAMLDSYYGVNITATDLANIKTIDQLWQIVQNGKTHS